MSLLQNIESDLKEAMKAHNVQVVSTLRMLTASIKNAVIAARTTAKTELDDLDIEKVVKSEVKKLRDAMTDFATASRQDLVDKANEELEILKKYLPPEMSLEQMEEAVRETIVELADKGDKEFGKVMKAVSAKLKNAADGKTLSELVKKLLN